MKRRDMRPWFVNDPTWTPGYVPTPEDDDAAPAPRTGLARLLYGTHVPRDAGFIGARIEPKRPA